MCDANGYAMRVVLGQMEDGKPYMAYYTYKTLNDAQRNYTIIEMELLVMVFTLDKVKNYPIRTSRVIFTNHSSLKLRMKISIITDISVLRFYRYITRYLT